MPMRRSLRTPLLALFLVVTGACRAPGGSSGALPAPDAYRGALVSSLQVEPGGDSVAFVLQVTNPTEAPVRLHFPTGQSFDFTVSDGRTELWRWSSDRSFTEALWTVTVAAGETRTYSASWRPAPALRGRRLSAVGRLTSTDHPVVRTAEFALP